MSNNSSKSTNDCTAVVLPPDSLRAIKQFQMMMDPDEIQAIHNNILTAVMSSDLIENWDSDTRTLMTQHLVAVGELSRSLAQIKF